MKFVTQFNPGEWWQSEDGQTWKRLFGSAARQLTGGLEMLEGAVAEIAEDGEDIVTIQLQLINPKIRKAPRAELIRKASGPPKKSEKGPITTEEIAKFHKWLSKSGRISPENK